jgi:putative flippase GtrA
VHIVSDGLASWVARTSERVRHPRAVMWSKYSAGSVIAFVTSEVVLVVLFATGLLGASAASVVAFFAGAVPNYVLNRSWVWQRRGRIRFGREVILYVLVSLVSLVAAAAATGAAAQAAPAGSTAGVVLVAVAYLVTYGVLFVLKFVVYDRVIFRD